MLKSTEKPSEVQKKVKSEKVKPEKAKLVRHKYKCDVGKKSYTFKNMNEISSGLGISRKTTNKLVKGEIASDKIKINLI